MELSLRICRKREIVTALRSVTLVKNAIIFSLNKFFLQVQSNIERISNHVLEIECGWKLSCKFVLEQK